MKTQQFCKVLLPYGLLGLSLSIAFIPLLLNQQFFYSYDLLYQNFWWRDFARWSLLNGHLPLTYYGEGCGSPLLAEGQIGFFYPINLFLYRFFDSWIGIQISIVFHTIWTLLGTYVLCRSLKASRFMSVMIACSFTYSGFMCIHATQVNLQAAASWLPWILFSLNQFLKRKKLFGIPLCISLSMPFLAGHPQIGLYSGLSALIWILFSNVNFKLKLRAVLILVSGVLIAGIQIVPSFVFFRASNRAGQDILDALSYSANPLLLYRCWTFLPPPPMFNTWTVFSQKGFDPSTLIESYQTIGLLLGPLFVIAAFIIFVLLLKKKGTIIQRNIIWMSFIWLMITLGKWGGIHWLLTLLPGFSGMRAPARAGFVLALLISMSIGIWLTKILPRYKSIRYIIVLVVVVVCVILVPLQIPMLNPTFQKDIVKNQIDLIRFDQNNLFASRGLSERKDWEPTFIEQNKFPKIPSERVNVDILLDSRLKPFPTIRTAGPVRLKELDQLLDKLDQSKSNKDRIVIMDLLNHADFKKDWTKPLYTGVFISCLGFILISVVSVIKDN